MEDLFQQCTYELMYVCAYVRMCLSRSGMSICVHVDELMRHVH